MIGRATVWLILASIVTSAGDAVMRKLFGLSSNFWLEGQWHLYAAAFLCAGGYVLLVDEHVRVDVLSQRFGPRLRAWLDPFVLLLAVSLQRVRALQRLSQPAVHERASRGTAHIHLVDATAAWTATARYRAGTCGGRRLPDGAVHCTKAGCAVSGDRRRSRALRIGTGRPAGA